MPINLNNADVFVGTLEEARQLPVARIAEAFSMGFLPPDLKAAAKFKALMIKHAASIKPGASKTIAVDTPFGRVQLEIRHGKDGIFRLRQATD